jgi:long-chain acyl-CoA synthetase
VLRDPNVVLEARELLTHCRRMLPFSKCPKVIVFGQDIPYTSTGKPKRLELKTLLAVKLEGYRQHQFKEESST